MRHLASVAVILAAFGACVLQGPVEDETPTEGAAAGDRPTLVDMTPGDNAVDVAVNAPIVVTFSAPMNPAVGTILVNDAPVTDCDWNVDNTQVTCQPRLELPPQELSTAEVRTDFQSAQGARLAEGLRVTFLTAIDLSSPIIRQSRPASDSSGASPTEPVVIQFSERMSPLTGTVDVSVNGLPYLGVVTSQWNEPVFDTLTVRLSPPPGPCDEVELLLDQQFRSQNNQPLQNPVTLRYVTSGTFGFLTESYPANGTADVPTNQHVALRFSSTMDTSVLPTATFEQGYTGGAPAVNWSGNGALLIVDPPGQYDPSSLVRLRVSGAVDDCGREVADALIEFATCSASGAPLSINEFLSVKNADLGVPIAAGIKVQFSSDVDPNFGRIEVFDQFGMSVPGRLEIDGDVATFSPGAGLTPGANHTAIIHHFRSVADSCGQVNYREINFSVEAERSAAVDVTTDLQFTSCERNIPVAGGIRCTVTVSPNDGVWPTGPGEARRCALFSNGAQTQQLSTLGPEFHAHVYLPTNALSMTVRACGVGGAAMGSIYIGDAPNGAELGTHGLLCAPIGASLGYTNCPTATTLFDPDPFGGPDGATSASPIAEDVNVATRAGNSIYVTLDDGAQENPNGAHQLGFFWAATAANRTLEVDICPTATCP